ncbi:MAG: hypothetical protein MZV49_07950 [Rhodopseudomonas palustris]|nr:hypothetical protein [Rhodopseudomonas palustris]
MALIESTIATGGDAFKANRDGMLALIARIRELEDARAQSVGRLGRALSTSAASCCRASASRCCSIPARRSSSCRRWPATCSTTPIPARACPAAA